MSIERRALSGTAVGVLAFVLNAAQTFLLVPVLLGSWGAARYGTWLALQAMVALFAMLNAGHQGYVGNEITRLYFADRQALRVTLASAIWAAAGIGAIELLLALSLGPARLLPRALGLPGDAIAGEHLYLSLVLCVAGWVLVGAIGGVIVRLLPAAGHFSRSIAWGMVGGVVQTVAIAAAALSGCGILGTTITYQVVAILYSAVLFWDIRRLLPDLWPMHRGLDRKVAAGNFGRSLMLTGAGTITQLQQNGLNLLVTGGLGAAALPAFSTARTVASTFLQGSNILCAPLAPEMVRFHVNREHSKLTATFAANWLIGGAATQLAILAALPVLAPLYVFWTRHALPFDRGLFALLAFAIALRTFGSPLQTYLGSTNHLRALGTINTAQSITVLVTAGLGIHWLGLHAIGLGVLAGEVVGSCAVPIAFVAPQLPAPWRGRLFRHAALGAAPTLVTGAALLGYARHVPAPVLVSSALLALGPLTWAQWRTLPGEVKVRIRGLRARIPGLIRPAPVGSPSGDPADIAPAGDSEAATPLWLRCVRASVSRRAVTVVVTVSLLLACGALAVLVAVPRHARDVAVVEQVFEYLRTTPPTDDILRQLPPERLESAHARLAIIVGKAFQPVLMLTPALLGALALGFALLARAIRRGIAPLRLGGASPRARQVSIAVLAATTALAVLAHWPYARQSLHFDEDGASVVASSGWLAWANNVTGWQNHVAASLSIRLSTALFGLSELSVRLPAVLASSAGLGFLCGYLWRRVSPATAVVTAALVMVLPLWAEQTSLARGYGLSFAAGAVLTVGVMRLHDEQERPSSAAMACVLAGTLVGCLAHFFFLFLVLGVVVLAWTSGGLSRPMRVALSWWIALALALPGLSLLVGLPAIAMQMKDLQLPPLRAIVERFTLELSLHHAGWPGVALTALSAGTVIASVISLPATARRPLLVILATAVALPVLMKPVYLYPRFFLHVLPALASCAGWFIGARLLRGRPVPGALMLLGLLALCAWTGPSDRLPPVDLRAAAAVARSERALRGDHFAIDTFLVSAMRFYNHDAGRIANVSHPVPDDVDELLVAAAPDEEKSKIPAGFDVERRLPGREHDVLLLRRPGE